MQDQLIGGLIMWVPGGLFFFGVISVIFFKWQQRGGDETVAGAQVAVDAIDTGFPAEQLPVS